MKRIQRQRTKGWRMPAGAVYVGRPTRWGNPYRPNWAISLVDSVNAYRGWANRQLRQDDDWLPPLRGKDLVCWCPLDQPCHADILLDLAR